MEIAINVSIWPDVKKTDDTVMIIASGDNGNSIVLEFSKRNMKYLRHLKKELNNYDFS